MLPKKKKKKSPGDFNLEEWATTYKWWLLAAAAAILTIAYALGGARTFVWAIALAGVAYGIAEFGKSPVKGAVSIFLAVLGAIYIAPLVAGGVGVLGSVSEKYGDARQCVDIICRTDEDLLAERQYEYSYKRSWLYRLFVGEPTLEAVQRDRERACEPCSYIKQADKAAWYAAKAANVAGGLLNLELEGKEYWCDDETAPANTTDRDRDNEGLRGPGAGNSNGAPPADKGERPAEKPAPKQEKKSPPIRAGDEDF